MVLSDETLRELAKRDRPILPAAAPREEQGDREEFVSATCKGEVCGICGQPAAMKVGEEIPYDDPFPNRHNATQYLCSHHGLAVLFPYRHRADPGCAFCASTGVNPRYLVPDAPTVPRGGYGPPDAIQRAFMAGHAWTVGWEDEVGFLPGRNEAKGEAVLRYPSRPVQTMSAAEFGGGPHQPVGGVTFFDAPSAHSARPAAEDVELEEIKDTRGAEFVEQLDAEARWDALHNRTDAARGSERSDSEVLVDMESVARDALTLAADLGYALRILRQQRVEQEDALREAQLDQRASAFGSLAAIVSGYCEAVESDIPVPADYHTRMKVAAEDIRERARELNEIAHALTPRTPEGREEGL